MQVFDVFDDYNPRTTPTQTGQNATQVMLVMKTLVQFTEQIYQHPFAPLHALPPCRFVFEKTPQRRTRKPYGFRSMRTRGQPDTQKDTSGAEVLPPVRRVISKRHRVVPAPHLQDVFTPGFRVQQARQDRPARGRNAELP